MLDPRAFVHIEISKPDEAGRPRRCLALIDTGATDSMISPELVRSLDLPVVDTFDFNNASGEKATTTLHVARLKLWIEPGQEASHKNVDFGKMLSQRYDYQAILGMNLLRDYRLTIANQTATLEALLD